VTTREVIMPYTIVFNADNTEDVWGTDAKTAIEAAMTIDALQRRGGQIRYIISPQEGEIGVEMLRVLAKEEEEELQAIA
jgi:hypothetical protein